MPFRVKNSPYYHYDFQIGGYRFSGSTKCRNERDAAERKKRTASKPGALSMNP